MATVWHLTVSDPDEYDRRGGAAEHRHPYYDEDEAKAAHARAEAAGMNAKLDVAESAHGPKLPVTAGCSLSCPVTASTGLDCYFEETEPGKWKYGLENDFESNHFDTVYDHYGPFSSFDQAQKHLQDNHANPGGYSIQGHPDSHAAGLHKTTKQGAEEGCSECSQARTAELVAAHPNHEGEDRFDTMFSCPSCSKEREISHLEERLQQLKESKVAAGPHALGDDVNQDRLSRFSDAYKEHLTQAVTDYPDEYVWPVENVPTVHGRMMDAIREGTYNKDSRAIKNTTKALGIPHTYQGIRDWLTSPNDLSDVTAKRVTAAESWHHMDSGEAIDHLVDYHGWRENSLEDKLGEPDGGQDYRDKLDPFHERGHNRMEQWTENNRATFHTHTASKLAQDGGGGGGDGGGGGGDGGGAAAGGDAGGGDAGAAAPSGGGDAGADGETSMGHTCPDGNFTHVNHYTGLGCYGCGRCGWAIGYPYGRHPAGVHKHKKKKKKPEEEYESYRDREDGRLGAKEVVELDSGDVEIEKGKLTRDVGGKPSENMDKVRELAEKGNKGAQFYLNVLSEKTADHSYDDDEPTCSEDGKKAIGKFLDKNVCDDHLRYYLADAPNQLAKAEENIGSTTGADRIKYETLAQKIKLDMKAGAERLQQIAQQGDEDNSGLRAASTQETEDMYNCARCGVQATREAVTKTGRRLLCDEHAETFEIAAHAAGIVSRVFPLHKEAQHIDLTNEGDKCECGHPISGDYGHKENGDCSADNCPCQVARTRAASKGKPQWIKDALGEVDEAPRTFMERLAEARCRECEGTGICSCGGSGRNCSDCQSTGICRTCGGSGAEDDPVNDEYDADRYAARHFSTLAAKVLGWTITAGAWDDRWKELKDQGLTREQAQTVYNVIDQARGHHTQTLAEHSQKMLDKHFPPEGTLDYQSQAILDPNEDKLHPHDIGASELEGMLESTGGWGLPTWAEDQGMTEEEYRDGLEQSINHLRKRAGIEKDAQSINLPGQDPWAPKGETEQQLKGDCIRCGKEVTAGDASDFGDGKFSCTNCAPLVAQNLEIYKSAQRDEILAYLYDNDPAEWAKLAQNLGCPNCGGTGDTPDGKTCPACYGTGHGGGLMLKGGGILEDAATMGSENVQQHLQMEHGYNTRAQGSKADWSDLHDRVCHAGDPSTKAGMPGQEHSHGGVSKGAGFAEGLTGLLDTADQQLNRCPGNCGCESKGNCQCQGCPEGAKNQQGNRAPVAPTPAPFMSSAEPQVGILYGDDGSTYTTENGGATWEKVGAEEHSQAEEDEDDDLKLFRQDHGAGQGKPSIHSEIHQQEHEARVAGEGREDGENKFRVNKEDYHGKYTDQKMEDCVQHLKADGHDEESAIRICKDGGAGQKNPKTHPRKKDSALDRLPKAEAAGGQNMSGSGCGHCGSPEHTSASHPGGGHSAIPASEERNLDYSEFQPKDAATKTKGPKRKAPTPLKKDKGESEAEKLRKKNEEIAGDVEDALNKLNRTFNSAAQNPATAGPLGTSVDDLKDDVGTGIHSVPVTLITDHRGQVRPGADPDECITCGEPMQDHAQWDLTKQAQAEGFDNDPLTCTECGFTGWTPNEELSYDDDGELADEDEGNWNSKFCPGCGSHYESTGVPATDEELESEDNGFIPAELLEKRAR